jgi:rare lipoprotein A
MLIRPKATNMNPKKPLPFWLMMGISCLAVAGLFGTILTWTVQADARLQGPIVTASPVVATATPVTSPAVQPAPNKHSKILRGIASWYGSVFNGRKTASGETYNMNDMTACHPTLPFGSLVRVVNLRNKKSVVVRITDRGDLGSNNGRIIDLSFAAAEKLEMTQAGLARVSVEVLSSGRPAGGE